MRRFLSAFLFIITLSQCIAQGDTTYFKDYKERLIITYFQTVDKYNINIKQHFTTYPKGTSASGYLAEANKVSGFQFQYDIFSVSVGFDTPVAAGDQYLKGNTSYTDIGITSIGNKISFEAKYQQYQGFYDPALGGIYDSVKKKQEPYYQDHSMRIENIKGKFYYFFNGKKFSFPSSYSCDQRQLKPVGSWFLVSNIYHFNMKSDTSFIPFSSRSVYGDYGKINSMGLFAFSVGGGGSYNLVWKRLFLNLTLGLGLEAQWRNYGSNNGSSHDHMVVAPSLETRAAIGYNNKNFYMSITSYNDYSNFTHSFLDIQSDFVSVSFNIGYRFKVPKPKIMTKIQETRIYKLF